PALGGETAARGARSVAAAAADLGARLERRLVAELPALRAPRTDGATPPRWPPQRPASCAVPPALPLAALRALPAELLPWVLAILHRRAGIAYPQRRRSVRELLL